jgi:hypothetical protein
MRGATSLEAHRQEALDSEESRQAAERVARAAVAQLEAQRTEPRFITGRVQFPDGTPADESVKVSVRGSPKGRAWSDEEWTIVERSGSFRAELRPDWEEIVVSLGARYLYLEENVYVDSDHFADEVVVRPKLGCSILGVLEPPLDRPTLRDAWIGKQVSLTIYEKTSANSASAIGKLTAQVDDHLQFEFDALDARKEFYLEAQPPQRLPIIVWDFQVAAGTQRRLELPLHAGVRIAGTVTDHAGQLVDAEIGHTVVPRSPQTSSHYGAPDKTSAGHFDLLLEAGEIGLTASSDGYLRTCRDLGSLDDGAERTDVVLVMNRGLSIAGRVQWADGKPAAGCALRIVPKRTSTVRTRGECEQRELVEAQSNGDGAFDVAGLGSEPCEVLARVPPWKKNRGTKESDDGQAFSAHAEDVVPGTNSLVLVLGQGESIDGIVVDEADNLLDDFEVRSMKSDPRRFGDGFWHEVTGSKFHAAAGRFHLAGLMPGRFDIAIQARDHAAAVLSFVELPSTHPLRVVLPRLAEVSGTVVDPSGAPVQRAHLHLDSVRPTAVFEGSGEENVTTDSEGRFSCSHVAPGQARITASADDWASSATTAVDVTPGGTTGDLRIVLRRGGRVTGEVLDAAGRARTSCGVHLSSFAGEWKDTQTDERGHFEFDRIAPGAYQIQAESDQPVPSMDASFASDRNTTTATIHDSDELHVVLGGAARARARVHGRITCGDSALAGISVVALVGAQSWARATSDGRGNYELVLDTAGEARVSLSGGSVGGIIERSATLENGKDLALDFDLPASRIAGRVLAPDGRGLGKVQLELQAERDAGFGHLGPDGWRTSSDDGRFSFEHLLPGAYSIRATMHSSDGLTSNVPFASPSVASIVLSEGKSVDGIEIRLLEAGRIRGVVRGADAWLAPQARVHVRDESGHLLTAFHNCTTDSQGRFELGGLPPGRMRVQARSDSAASSITTVDVRGGATTDADLTLAAATILAIVIEGDGDPNSAPPALSIVDDRGNEFGNALDTLDWRASAMHEDQPGTWIGPLAPGRYTVAARDRDGRHAETEVRANGERQLAVSLHLAR